MEKKKKKQSVQTIQTKTRVEKGKSGIASVIFGRTGIILLLVLLQAFFLIAGYTYLQGKCILSIPSSVWVRYSL